MRARKRPDCTALVICFTYSILDLNLFTRLNPNGTNAQVKAKSTDHDSNKVKKKIRL